MILFKLKELKHIEKLNEKSKLIDEILVPRYINFGKKEKISTPKEKITIADPDAAAFIIKKMILDDLSMKQEMKERSIVLTNRQKLAVFLYTIRREVNPELFNYLSKDELETIIHELKQLEAPDPEQQEAVIQEFHDLMMNYMKTKKK